MANRLTKMLASPDKEVAKTSGANGVLSRLFREVLKDLGIGGIKFSSLMQDYLLNPRNNVPNNRKDQTSMRGNLTKEFARPQMTWKVFCKALRFLQFDRVEFILVAHHVNGEVTQHATTINFGLKSNPDFMRTLEQAEEHEDQPYVPYLDERQRFYEEHRMMAAEADRQKKPSPLSPPSSETQNKNKES